VKRDDFDTEIARVRQEMANGDQRVAGQASSQVSALEARMDARFQTLEQSLRTMEDEFGMRVDRLEGSLRVHTPLHFGFNESTLESDEVPVLGRLAEVLREYYPEALVTVEGFTDPAGSRAYNLQLGQKRAEEVRAYLIAAGGLSPAQVKAVSYGEDTARLILPGASGPGDLGRENRRAVIVIDHSDAGAAQRVTSAPPTT
jgi:peptidoglycan-associated lipoprotein